MTIGAPELSGRVTFVTGPEKGSGKTAFLNYALGLLRRSGEAPAYLGVGLNGDEGGRSLNGDEGGRGLNDEAQAGGRASAMMGPSSIPCLPGELFLSAERYLRASGCEPEIAAVLPGSGALGRLAIARARRPGLAVLVGPERNELAASAIAIMRDELGAGSVLVDGSMNRITQVSSFAGARFYFAMRAGPGELEPTLRSMRRITLLTGLPELGEAAREDPASAAAAAGLPAPARRVKGPLTEIALSRLCEGVGTIVVEDLTKVFLGYGELRALLRTRSLAVLHGLSFGGFVLRLRDLTRAAFSAALGDPALEATISFNPYEARSHA
jgi:hypothetical protein